MGRAAEQEIHIAFYLDFLGGGGVVKCKDNIYIVACRPGARQRPRNKQLYKSRC
jgi:hypothetical protein